MERAQDPELSLQPFATDFGSQIFENIRMLDIRKAVDPKLAFPRVFLLRKNNQHFIQNGMLYFDLTLPE